MRFSRFTKPVLTGAFAAALVGSCAIAVPATAADGGVTPKNVIVLIGDGMGYNHIDLMNAEDKGEVHWQVQRGGDNKVNHSGQNTVPTEGWQAWDHLAMSTNWAEGPAYDPAASWSDFEWNKNNPTDSAAAGTAMATGVKTYNAGLGVDVDGNVLENVSQRAHELGKSAGVVSSVPYSHATPAAYSAHNETRNNYHAIAQEQVHGDLEVIMGAAHPFYDDDHQKRDQGDFSYISEEDWNAVANGETDRTFIETNEDFEALTTGDTPEKVFATAQVASTLQQARSEGAPLNDVVDLPTMTAGALNVLDNNDEGFSLMVEGGAIDWTGHANQSERNVEETRDFDAAVDTVIDWVETNSSWDETLVVVTADHETGYLYGETPGDFTPIVPGGAEQTAEDETTTEEETTAQDETTAEEQPVVDENGEELTGAKLADATEPEPALPAGVEDQAAENADETEVSALVEPVAGVNAAHSWNSDNHTNMLVPFFYKGAGAEQVTALGTGLDLVRGHYLDNTSLATWLLDEAWVPASEPPVDDEEPTEEPPVDDEQPTEEEPTEEQPVDDDQPVADEERNDGSSADARAESDDRADGELAVTGSELQVLPLALVAAALVLGGGAMTVARLRRRAADR